MKGYEKSRGFTLIELAIVLVIIGLLLGAVMKGKELIQAAKVKRVMKQAHAAISVAETFYDYTGKWPGAFSTDPNNPATRNPGTDICSLEIVRLISDNGTTYCAAPEQRAFEFWGYDVPNTNCGNNVSDKNGTTGINQCIILDGMGRELQGQTDNAAANTLYPAYGQNDGVVCFFQDAWNGQATTTAAQRKAMLSIARMYAGDTPIFNVNCVTDVESSACIVDINGNGTTNAHFEALWAIGVTSNMKLLSSPASKRMQACVRLSVD
ncbi:MAG: type II secretion system protein [Aquificae bacterium]|nr:type II secretion system protein [Aquificota bacterium]